MIKIIFDLIKNIYIKVKNTLMDDLSVIQSHLEWANRSYTSLDSKFEEFAWIIDDHGTFDEISALRLSREKLITPTDLTKPYSKAFRGHALVFTSSSEEIPQSCGWIFEPVLTEGMKDAEHHSIMGKVGDFRNLIFNYHHSPLIGWNLEFSSPRIKLENVLLRGAMEVDLFSPGGEQVVYFPNNHKCHVVAPAQICRPSPNGKRGRVHFSPSLNLVNADFDISLVPCG